MKLRIYARSRIPKYVVVDLVHQVVLVYTKPVGQRYSSAEQLSAGDTLRLDAGRGEFVNIAVSKLL